MVPSQGVTNPVKTVNKVGLTKSGRAKKVHFANVNLGVLGMSAECVRMSESGQGLRDSGSMGCVPGTILKCRWVLKTKNPNIKISPGNSLLDLESGNGPRCISGSGGLCKPVETCGGYSHDWVGARWSFNCPFRLLMNGVAATRGYNWSLNLFLGTGGLEDWTVKMTQLLTMGLLG
ncbi:unnamed protein product [Cuscuta campestris]|uniref:Uncharacterized protein n=1 Tax=Cuscuta campestris TaxID=132261 RepID=A0A484LF69_9ASTE|nr:unnamed protein product [Cuscuta campestris]